MHCVNKFTWKKANSNNVMAYDNYMVIHYIAIVKDLLRIY